MLKIRTVTLVWDYDELVCYKDIFFNIAHCLLVNGVPDPSQCTSYTTTNMTITVELLTSTSYIFMITVQSVQYLDIISDTVEVEITMLGKSIGVGDLYIYIYIDLLKFQSRFIDAIQIEISQNPVCYDTDVKLTCHHHDITDTTLSGPIFNQTSPVVWMKDGERIDLPDTYHMVVWQSNTETVVSVTTRKSVFLNGEANYSCAVVYADGSMEESEPVTVRVRGISIQVIKYQNHFFHFQINLQ